MPGADAVVVAADAEAVVFGASAFYAQRFGQLGVEDLPEARRSRRLVAVQLGSERTDALWRQGADMSMADAMRLALALTTGRR